MNERGGVILVLSKLFVNTLFLLMNKKETLHFAVFSVILIVPLQ